MGVHSDIHRKRRGYFWEIRMRVAVKMPGAVMGTVPDAHGIVAEHDGLAMYGDFCEVVEPRKILAQLASFFVVIAGHRKNLLAANLPPVLQN